MHKQILRHCRGLASIALEKRTENLQKLILNQRKPNKSMDRSTGAGLILKEFKELHSLNAKFPTRTLSELLSLCVNPVGISKKEFIALLEAINQQTNDPKLKKLVSMYSCLKLENGFEEALKIEIDNKDNLGDVRLALLYLHHHFYGSLSTLSWMDKILNEDPDKYLNNRHWNAILRYLANDGHVEQCKSIMYSKNLRVDRNSWNVVLGFLVGNNRVNEARDFFQELKDKVTPNGTTYNFMIQNVLYSYARQIGQYRSGRKFKNQLTEEQALEEAELYRQKMLTSGIKESSWTKDIYMTFYTLLNEKEKAEAILLEMEEKGPHPSLKSYGIMVSYYFKRGDLKNVNNILKRFKSRNLTFDRIMYCICIDGHRKLGNIRKSMQYFKEMVEMGFDIDYDRYFNLIDMYCEAGDIGLAVEVYEDYLKHHKHNELIDCLFLKCYFKRNEFEKAMELFQNIKNKTIKSYNNMISLLVKNEKIQDAFQIVDQMIANNIKYDMYTSNIIMQAYTKVGDEPQLLQAFEKHISSGFPTNSYSLNILIQFYAQKKEFSKAMKILKFLEDITQKQPRLNLEPAYSATVLMHQLKEAQQPQELQKMFEKNADFINCNSVVMDIYIRFLFDNRNFGEITEVFWQAIGEGFCPDQRLLNTYLSIMYRFGSKSECDKIIKWTIDEGIETDGKFEFLKQKVAILPEIMNSAHKNLTNQ